MSKLFHSTSRVTLNHILVVWKIVVTCKCRQNLCERWILYSFTCRYVIIGEWQVDGPRRLELDTNRATLSHSPVTEFLCHLHSLSAPSLSLSHSTGCCCLAASLGYISIYDEIQFYWRIAGRSTHRIEYCIRASLGVKLWTLRNVSNKVNLY